MTEELHTYFVDQMSADNNIIATYTDIGGMVNILVRDDAPEAIAPYATRADGVKIRKSEPIVAWQSHTRKWRPAPGGVSTISMRAPQASGTLSMVIRDKTDGALSVLSNNHVYAEILHNGVRYIEYIMEGE